MKSSEINRWITRIRLSEAERQLKQPLWDDFARYFRGTQWKSTESGKDMCVVNLMYPHVKIVIPSVYSRNPKVYIEPDSSDRERKAKVNELILNKDMRTIGMKKVNKRIIQDAIIYGTGFSKTTYEMDGEIEEQDKPVVDDLTRRFQNTKADSIEGGSIRIPRNGPREIRVAPWDLTFALGIMDFADPGFISHKFRKRLSAVKNDPYYKNTKDLQPTKSAGDSYKSDLSEFWVEGVSDEDNAIVECYEIWDVEEGKYFVIAEGHSKALREPEDNPYLSAGVEHPFDRLVFTELDDQIWGLSELEPWMPLQDELNKLRVSQLQHVKRFNRKYLVAQRAMLEEEQKLDLERGKDGTVLVVSGEGDVRGQVASLEDAPMPADSYRVTALVEDDIVKVSGQTPYRRGGTVGANTATEANLAESSASARDSDRVDQIGEFAVQVLEKIRRYRKAFTPGVQAVKITGDPSVGEEWDFWRKEDVDTNMEMRLEYGSTLPLNQTNRIAEAVQLYDRGIANPTVNPQSAYVALLEAFDEHDVSKYFVPQELIQLHLMMRLIGQAQAKQPGVSPSASSGGGEPGNTEAAETPAELGGRAAGA